MQPEQIQAFLTKWEVSGAAERANAHLFVTELWPELEVEPPQPSTPNEHLNAYCSEGKRTKKRLDEMTRLLETLAAVGRARRSGEGWMSI